MQAPVRLGVLGCADVAARRILPAATSCPRLTVAAVASRSADKADDFARRFDVTAVTGYDELLRREDIDAVYLPLPSALHAEWIERALLSGKDVLAEKPLTTSAQDTERLLRMAARRGLVLMENYMFLAHTQHAAVRELLDQGTIGTVLSFAATFAIPRRPGNDIRLDPLLGGGALLDVAGYPLRAALHFLGTGLRLVGAARGGDAGGAVDLSGAALLAGPAGVTAQLTFGLRHAYTSGYTFLGSEGRLALDHVFTTPAGHRPVVRLEHQDRSEQRTLPADDQYAGALARFAQAVLTRENTGGADTLAQSRLIDQIGHRPWSTP